MGSLTSLRTRFASLITLAACGLVGAPALEAQTFSLVRHLKRTPMSEYIDCWGYRHPATGREFAVVAEQQGIWIVETTDPANITPIQFFSAPQSLWRDFECFGNYIYAGSEDHRGFRIIDMTNPGAPKDLGLVLTAYHRNTHNLAVDPESGLMVVCGATTNGLFFYDVKANPELPVPMALGGTTGYIHDACLRRNRAYLSVGYERKMRILDVTNPLATRMIAEFHTPGTFTHNAWVTEDDKLLVVTDEFTAQADPPHMTLWDIRTASTPVKKGAYIVPGHTVHYAFTMGRVAYLSHYGDGVHMVDISDPTAPKRLGRYDTSTKTGIRGCWGIYPFTDSGLIYASDMDNGLYVLRAECGHLNRYGEATPGSNGKVPNIKLLGGAPKVDSPNLKFKFEGLLPNANFKLLIGVAPGAMPILGITLHINPGYLRIFNLRADANGELVIPTPIADNPALSGARLYLQVAGEDAGKAGGFSASRGIWLGICPK